MSNDTESMNNSAKEGQPSSVGQTANINSTSRGAAKVFREFKWGLLTLFLLMVVVIGLVYDGGRKKKAASAVPKDSNVESVIDGATAGTPPSVDALANNDTPVPPAGNTPPSPPADSAAPTVPPGPATPQVQGSQQTAPVSEESVPPPTPVAPLPPVSVPTADNSHRDSHRHNRETTERPKGHDAASADPAPGNEHAASGGKTYVVKSGDTLTRIANSQLPGKGNVKAILAANKDVLPDPNKLKVGMKLTIPASLATVAEKHADATPAPRKMADETKKKEALPPAPEGSEYVVQSGDSLERIARRVFNDGRRWRDIYEWNRDELPSPSQLRIGQTLKIKPASEAAKAQVKLPEGTHHANAAEFLDPEPAGKSTARTEEKEPAHIEFMSTAAQIP